MTQDPQIRVSGPMEGGSATGPDLELYLVEEATDNAQTESNRRSIPGQEDTQSILAALTGKREFSWDGIGNGLRLQYAGYGSDPVEALHQWLIELESLVLTNQGQGYSVSDDHRNLTLAPTGDTPGILFDSVRWSHQSGEPTFCKWRLTGVLTEGVQPGADRQEYINDEVSNRNPSLTTDSLQTSDGISFSLGHVKDRSYEREIDLDAMNLIHQYDVPQVGIGKSGVLGTFDVSGQITRNDVSDLGTVARQLGDDIHGVDATIEDGFSGRTYTGVVTDSNATFKAGIPDILEYRVELEIGGEHYDSIDL